MLFDQFSRSLGMSPQEVALMHARRKAQAAAPRDLNAHKRTMGYRSNPVLEGMNVSKPMPAPADMTMPEGVSPYRLLGGLSQQERDSLAATRPENGMMGMPIAGNPLLDHPAWKGGLPGTSGKQAPEPPPPMFDQFAHQQRRDRLAAQRSENKMTGLMGDQIDGPPQNLGSLGALGAGNPVIGGNPMPNVKNPVLDGLLNKAIEGGKGASSLNNPVLNGGVEPKRPDPGVMGIPGGVDARGQTGGFRDRLDEFMANGGAQGLMAFGANMLAASGPSSTPTNLGQAIGEGAQAALGAMASHKANEHQRQLQQVQMALAKKRLEAGSERKTAEDVNGRLRYVDDGSLVFDGVQAAPKAASPTDDIREYEYARNQGFDGSFVDYQQLGQTPSRRRIVNGPDGSPYYEDGTPVLPGVQAPEAGPDFKTERDLRTEYQGHDVTKNFNKIEASYRRITASDNTAVGDLSLIFNYMKMLDPGSVVREGEFATAQNTTGVPGRILSAYNNALRGERLTPAQRDAFTAQARELYDTTAVQMRELNDYYTGLAGEYGMEPGRIIGHVREYGPIGENADGEWEAVTLLDGETVEIQQVN
ncbi:MAG: hypothetical protein AAGF20_10855 [Pseudomonadota bacterium]